MGAGFTGVQVSTGSTELDVSNLRTTATQIDFDLTASSAAALGARTLTVSSAAGSASISITVNPVLPKLSLSPQPIALPPSNTARNFFVSLSSADNIPHTVNLVSANTAIATVSPASITVPAGRTEVIVAVTGKANGTTAISLTSPDLAGTSVPVFVTAEFSGITTSFAPALGLVVQQAPGQSSTAFGPFASPLVGIAKGAYIDRVAPGSLAIGSGPTNVVISGGGLSGVTGVAIAPSTGLTLGAVSVAPDGRSVTVPVTVAANAPTSARRLVVAGASQPYLAARPGADQILITLPPPEIVSIDPIFAVAGSTAMTLTVRGRNLQSPQSVALTPSSGITVSNSPVASADGTSLTVQLSVSPLAPTGPRIVTVTTAGGASDATASPANSFAVVNEVQAMYAPIASALLGVVVEPPPATQALSAFASLLGVVVPPAATGIAPAAGIVGESVTLAISGFGLNSVTTAQLFPADGLTLGPLSVAPDGLTVSVPVTIAANAPQSLREVRLFTGGSQVNFTNAAAALFRVSGPLPAFDSMTPIVLQVGAAPVTLTISGRNFQNASLVRVDPASGITVSPPTVNAAGTQASVTVSAAAGTAIGARAVIVATPSGESPGAQTATNTLTLVNSIEGSVTPISAADLGVVLESAAPPAELPVGPFVARQIGVVVEAVAPPPAQEVARATIVGVAIGPFATGVQVPPLTPTSSATLVVSGVGLADVTALQIVPSTGMAVGALTIAPDGTQVSAPLTLSGAAAGLRGVRVLRGASRVPFLPVGSGTFVVGVGTPSIDSISPILGSRGSTFNLTLRGQNFQGVTAVTAAPGSGILIDNAPSVNAAGTEVTVAISIATDAPPGANVLRVVTPGGATREDAVPANTFTVLE
jgi:hypothetical protein